MSLLVESPNVEYYQSLPHICQAAKDFESSEAEKLVLEVGEIFVKHGAYEDFGLTLLHRHFDMTTGEILVETFNETGNISVALPWSFKGKHAAPRDLSLMEDHALTPGKYVVPQTWAFSGPDASLVAYEFLSNSEELSPPAADFTADLFAALKSRGLEYVVGIRRLLKIRDNNSWETTPEGIRANITHHGLVPPTKILGEKMIKVVFAFNEAGQLRCVAVCGSCHNCNHCNHCNHCTHY